MQQKMVDDDEELAKEIERRKNAAKHSALEAQTKTSKYLQKTMQEYVSLSKFYSIPRMVESIIGFFLIRVRDKTRNENERNSAELNRRISAALSLKRNITTNKVRFIEGFHNTPISATKSWSRSIYQ